MHELGRDRLFLGQAAGGGGGAPNECGWLIDKFGLSWQVTPIQILDYLKNSDTAASQRAMKSMMTMAKLDMAVLKNAYEGG